MKTYLCRGPDQLQQMADVIRSLSVEEPWEVEVRQYRVKRSGAQNRLLWAIYTAMAEHTGHSPEEVHEAMKSKFLPRRVVTVGNEELVVLGSSAKLDVKEFSDFVEQVQMFASQELGIVV